LRSLLYTSGLTGNYNNYSSAELEKALQSWVDPYPKPIILNHDLNSEPIGRVIAARMDKEEDGASFVRLQIAITDPVAAQKVSDKRYLTGSVGGRAGKAVCSITGEDLASESSDGRPKLPKYKRGQVYKGKLAFIDMQDISFKEYSFVNQPADQRSSVRSSKKADGQVTVTDSQNWVAKSAAFVLHMNEEDIVSINENQSILSSLKKKESKPLYMHMKGAFLSAIAIQESENSNSDNTSLLSNENKDKDSHEEISSMSNDNTVEDILAQVEELSEDLSVIASEAVAEDSPEDEKVEDTDAGEEVETSEEADKEESSNEDSEEAGEQDPEIKDEVEPDSAEESEESDPESGNNDETPAAGEDNGEAGESDTDLSEQSKFTEQEVEELKVKIQSLQEENSKLRTALHRTLAERVVDTKIAVGTESIEDREELIADHVKRSVGSLADSLRDLAKMPAVKKDLHGFNQSLMESEVVLEKEENVLLVEEDEVSHKAPRQLTAEELFVDALMGRRKL
jgi:hypothetical protein